MFGDNDPKEKGNKTEETKPSLGGVLGDVVGGAVGGLVGDAVGGLVGDTVGDAVGDAVGGVVGDLVGSRVDEGVDTVKKNLTGSGSSETTPKTDPETTPETDPKTTPKTDPKTTPETDPKTTPKETTDPPAQQESTKPATETKPENKLAALDNQESAVASVPPSGKQVSEEMAALSNIKVDTAFANSAFDTLGGLSFDKLIGEPLRAAVKAQRDMAKEALNYIKKETIVSGKDGESQLAYVTLNFVKEGKETRMRIPLLTLIPYPSLNISSLTYKFTAKIDASSNVTLAVNADTSSLAKAGTGGAAANSGSPGGGGGGGGAAKTDTKNASGAAAQRTPNASSVSATYSSKPGSSAVRDSRYSVETTIDMTVTAGTTDPPAGITKIIGILDSSAEVIDTDGKLTLSSSELTLAGGHALLSASYRDGKGASRRDLIKCKVYKEGEGKLPDVMTNGDEVLFLFSEKGTYLIQAGEFNRFVFVS